MQIQNAIIENYKDFESKPNPPLKAYELYTEGFLAGANWAISQRIKAENDAESEFKDGETAVKRGLWC